MEISVGFNAGFREVNNSTKRYVMLKGSAGSGKSQNVAQILIIKLADPKYKGANLLCVRKIDDSNRDSTFAQLNKAIKTIYGAEWEKYWKVTSSPMKIYCKITGAVILFRGMKDDSQREKVKSITNDEGNITWIWVEEATELTTADFQILNTRLRGKLDNPNLYYQIICTFNPVSSTHWIKGRFFDNPDENTLTHSSTLLENRFIDEQFKKEMEAEKDRDYEHYRVYYLGDWGQLGNVYFDNFKADVHVCKPFKIPDNWTRFRCMDWGSYHPYACYWCAVDYDGTIYVYRELYGYGGKANVGTKESSRTVAQKIAAAEASDRNLIGYGILDNACWNKQDPGSPSISEEINRVLLEAGSRPFGPSIKSREQVGEELRLRLEGFTDKDGTQKPGLIFFSNCFHAIRTFPEITHDKNQPEKYDTNGEDHCFVAGTIITTLRGDVPIEDVTIDDYVLTRKGYRRVVASALTRKNANVYKLVASNGCSLVGTGNHPVYVKGKGFVALDTIGYGDMLYCRGDKQCQDHKQKQQKALSSYVEKNTKQINTEGLKPVDETVVLSCQREPSTADVYNLTVDEVHEYFANGFLVHNCVDAIGYGCMSRPYKPERPKKKDAWTYDSWADKPNPTSPWGL